VWGQLDQLNLSTGRVMDGPLVFTDAETVTVGNEVALLEPSHLTVGPDGQISPGDIGAEMIQVLRRNSTLLGPGRVLQAAGPATGTVLLARSNPGQSGGFWVAVGRTLTLYSVDTGRILRRLRPLPAPITSIVVSPNGRMLYAEIVSNTLPVVFNTVEQIDALSGAILASRVIMDETEVHVVSAVANGVWSTASSGTATDIMELTAPHLAIVQLSENGAFPALRAFHSIAVFGGVAWVYSPWAIGCVSTAPNVRSAEWFAGVYSKTGLNFNAARNPFVPVASVGQLLYGFRLTEPNLMYELTPPRNCW
jgi:hypothetical protein